MNHLMQYFPRNLSIIVALYMAGESIGTISEKLDTYRETVSQYIKAAGFVVKRGCPGRAGSLVVRVPTEFASKSTISSSGCPPGLGLGEKRFE